MNINSYSYYPQGADLKFGRLPALLLRLALAAGIQNGLATRVYDLCYRCRCRRQGFALCPSPLSWFRHLGWIGRGVPGGVSTGSEELPGYRRRSRRHQRVRPARGPAIGASANTRDRHDGTPRRRRAGGRRAPWRDAYGKALHLGQADWLSREEPRAGANLDWHANYGRKPRHSRPSGT